MSSFKPLAISLLSLSACVVSNPFPSDTFDSVATESDTNNESGTGDGDGDPATGDGDGDATTTGDGDGDATTTGDGDATTTGDGDATTTGDGDGDATTTGDGDGDGEPVCMRRRWRFDFGDDTWSSVALDSSWAGPNAPPCDVEIWGTTYIEAQDQLLVFAADGSYYRKQGNSWAAASTIAAEFPQLGNKTVESVMYVPSINGDPAQVLINSLPNAYLYYIAGNGDISHFDTVPIGDEPPPGPPQSDVVRNWSLVLGNGDLLGQAEWWIGWQRFENGRVYRVDGGFTWANWPEDNNPLFSGGNDEPDPATIEAAWGDFDEDRGYFIGF